MSIVDKLSELSGTLNESLKILEDEQEVFWKSLSQEEQLKAFCAVVRRIYQGEIIDQGSYRHVLYTTFGFGAEAYVQAQVAGYLEIHNMLVQPE